MKVLGNIFSRIGLGLLLGVAGAVAAMLFTVFLMGAASFLTWQAPTPDDWARFPAIIAGAARFGGFVGFCFGLIVGGD